MFNFGTINMYRTKFVKLRKKPKVLHRETCPVCGKKLVNIYTVSEEMEKKYGKV